MTHRTAPAHIAGIATFAFALLALGASQASAQIAVSCDQTAQTLAGAAGASLTVVCPANCASGTVWGTDIYSDDSAVCTAVIHAGVLSNNGGTVQINIAAGQNSYTASARNGVSTSSWGQWNRSFTVSGAMQRRAAEPANAIAYTCAQTAQELGDEPGSSTRIYCPANCENGGTIWGTDIYSDDSAVCTAAIHAGALPNAGGTVNVVIAPGQASYPASVRKGIASASWGQWNRSFRFE